MGEHILIGFTKEERKKTNSECKSIKFCVKSSKCKGTKIMKFDEVEKCNSTVGGGDWNVFYWILGAICMPIALPLVLVNVLKKLRAQKYRNCLPGKVVLITGASSGLGEALSHVFYKAGCKVILCARRLDELERVKKDLLALEANPITFPPTVLPLDLTELNDIAGFVSKSLAIHNQIDILINNGGISVRADALSSAVDVDLKVMLVNYFGAVALTKAVLPSMIKRKTGHVCFVSSVQGKFALPYRSSYSASKHAIQAFADSLRAEVASKGVKVICVSPGYIRTQLSVNALTASGQNYGKMDKTTAAGMAPECMANKILLGILRNDKDIVICDLQAKLAFWLRFLCPSLYFWLMEKRAFKLENAEEEEGKKDA